VNNSGGIKLISQCFIGVFIEAVVPLRRNLMVFVCAQLSVCVLSGARQIKTLHGNDLTNSGISVDVRQWWCIDSCQRQGCGWGMMGCLIMPPSPNERSWDLKWEPGGGNSVLVIR